MANETLLANLTGNITDPSLVQNIGTNAFQWIWNATVSSFQVMDTLFRSNPVIAIIIILLTVGISFWLLSWLQEAGAKGMKIAVWLMMFFVLVVIIYYYIWPLFQPNVEASNFLHSSMGLPLPGNETNATAEVAKSVSDKGGISFWK